jgi:hypothetical protein
MKIIALFSAAICIVASACSPENQPQPQINEPAGASRSVTNETQNKTAAQISNEQGNSIGTNSSGRSIYGGAGPAGANSNGRTTP